MKIFAFDSYEGLPENEITEDDDSVWKKGEFCGSLDEVKNNVAKYKIKNIEYIKSLAFAEFKVGNMVSSIDLYTIALEKEPSDFKTALEFSSIYHESGDIDKAICIIEDAIDESPSESLLYYRLVIYLMDAGKYKESINVLESALSLNFDNHEVLFDFVPNFETQSALIRVINQYRKNNLK